MGDGSHAKKDSTSIKPGIRADLEERLKLAEEEHLCLVPQSAHDARRLRAATARGALVSPVQGLYARTESWANLSPVQKSRICIRTLQKTHPEMVFCGASAAIIHGLAVSYQMVQLVHLATTRKTHGRAHGMRGAERHLVLHDSYEEVDGIRVTSFERTVFDCLRTCDFQRGLAVADSALRKNRVSQDHLAGFFEMMDYRFRGRRRAIETLALADGRAESGGESVARAVMIERGYRLPDLQYELPDLMSVGETYRADFYWKLGDAQSVIGELDGREKYVNPAMTGGKPMVDVLADERLRESRISGMGAKIMRFGFADVLNTSYFMRLLSTFGIPRDAEIPQVAVNPRDPEARLTVAERYARGVQLAAESFGKASRAA